MSGAERAQIEPDGFEGEIGTDWIGAPDEVVEPKRAEAGAARPRSIGIRLFGALLLLLALAWLGAIGASLWEARPAPTLPNVISWTATVSGPLVLLAILWLLLGRTSRRETERFTRAVDAMTAESRALESVLEIVSARIEDNHSRLRGEAEKLMSLGDEASDRLGRVTHYLSRETATLDKKAAALDAAAAAAKVDVGVLLHDLPRAEEQARAVAEAMKEAGLSAHGQASALEAQLASLAARGRDADEVLGGAAQRLGAHVARIETGSAAAAASMEDASAKMNAAVDAAMARAAEAIDSARTAIDAQSSATLAAIEQNHAALERTGDDSAKSLSQRLDSLSASLEGLGSRLAAQDAASHALVTGLGKELAELDSWFDQLGKTGTAHSEHLAASVQAVRDATRSLIEEIGGGRNEAGALIESGREMSQLFESATQQLAGPLPAALAGVEEQAGRTRDAVGGLTPEVEAIQGAAEAGATRIAEAEASVARQREAIDALYRRIEEGSAGAEEQLRALGEAAGEAEATARRLAAETGPELIEALLRVREAANQASERAREAISAAIPASAASLGAASREAIEQAIADTVERQMAEVSAVSERALATARKASERLTRQMLTLGETAATIEARIDEARREREEKEADTFSRRVALLIESLNSTAIDVTKILSNEVTDSAWAAYLKGDRGVFTRRAVRLLDNAEAKEIARHYEEEAEFREQVNRYINDFEAMLRRILADSEGNPIAITLLSSDMGKLYVALAQAIQHLRV
jgi:hypothetical protein